MNALEFLVWAYGKAAGQRYQSKLLDGQRSGQAFMNILSEYDPNSYARLAGSVFDPFYVDSKIFAAIDRLTRK